MSESKHISTQFPAPLLAPGRLASLWSPVVWLLAEGLGLRLDRVYHSIEPWITYEGYYVASGLVPAGTMGAMRFRLVTSSP